jgi:glycosyltransferase involved in cell wall biosynthesis
MSAYDFFLLPTKGENFGYAILEAMAAGCPAIVSDRTPWRDLAQAGSGWALPLENRDAWHQVLQQCVDMGPEEHARLSTRAREYVQKWAAATKGRGETIELFDSALKGLSQAGRANPLPAMKGLPD